MWEITATKKKGRGVFAKKDIKPGTVIGDYIGKVIRTAEENTYEGDLGLYLMYYHDYASLYPMDIKKPGIHLLNHSCTPNNWMYTYKGHTLFFALRHIFAGEELTVSYLLSPDEDCNPCVHQCVCESVICTGSMHQSKIQFETWTAFNEDQMKQTKRARIRYGRELPALSSYPNTIADHPVYTLFGAPDKPALLLDNRTMPDVEDIRKKLRETGKQLQLTKLRRKILGIHNNQIVSRAS
jgi:hypothetical protein